MEKERKSPNDMKYISKKELKLYNKLLQYNIELQKRRQLHFTIKEEDWVNPRVMQVLNTYQELGKLLFWLLSDEILKMEENFKDCI